MESSRTSWNRAELVIRPVIWRSILTRKRRMRHSFVLAKRTHVAFLPHEAIAPRRHYRSRGRGSASGELGEALEIAPFGDLRRPGREIVALDRGREFGRRAEEPARLAGGKSGEPRRLEIGGGTA